MDAINKLLDKAKETRSLKTDAALAELLGVDGAAVSNWRKEKNLPDVVHCDKLARICGEDPLKVIARIEEKRARSEAAKTVWRRLAAATMLAGVCIVSGATYAPQSEAATTPTMYIMSTTTRTRRRRKRGRLSERKIGGRYGKVLNSTLGKIAA